MSNIESLLQNSPISSRLNYISAHRIAELFYSQVMDAHKTSEKDKLTNCLIFCLCHLSTTVNLSICNIWMKTFDNIHLIPKRSSLNTNLLRHIHNPTHLLKSRERSEFHKTVEEIDLIATKSKLPIILFDIGGYFTPYIPNLLERFGDRLLLVLEDTANGHIKYTKAGYNTSERFQSVAYDPYKMVENVMVANIILGHLHSFIADWSPYKTTLVIGYGRIGRSLCFGLRSRGAQNIVVIDTDRARLFMASTEGFEARTSSQLEGKIDHFDYCFSMSGQQGITDKTLSTLKNNSYITVVTSYDDEFDGLTTRLLEKGNKNQLEWNGKKINIVNGGRPINLSAYAAFDARNLSLHLIFGRIFSAFLSSLGCSQTYDWEENAYSEIISEIQAQ
jgi:S-adenosylhomocysteine hydrolase